MKQLPEVNANFENLYEMLLGIFQNANEDETINIQDVTQIELTIPGRERRG